jgi:hypothetical protein
MRLRQPGKLHFFIGPAGPGDSAGLLWLNLKILPQFTVFIEK